MKDDPDRLLLFCIADFHSLYSNVNFSLLFFENDSCNTINEYSEGVEFSVRTEPGEVWIPISLLILHSTDVKNDHADILLGEKIRGYRHTNVTLAKSKRESFLVQLCDISPPPRTLQFRWMHTSRSHGSARDTWSLDDVWISYDDGEISQVLLEDNFDDERY